MPLLPGMLPVGHAHEDLGLDVLHDVLPGLGVRGRRGRDQAGEVAGLDVGGHSTGLDVLE